MPATLKNVRGPHRQAQDWYAPLLLYFHTPLIASALRAAPGAGKL